MFYSFDEHEATEYGVSEAILLDFLKRDALMEMAHMKDKRTPHKVRGFVQLGKFGNTKLVRFTDKCAYWERKI